jgi:hypothetical protein
MAVLGRCTSLVSVGQADIIVAVLRVIEILDDKSALFTIRNLAAWGSTPSIRTAASACLIKRKEQKLAPRNVLLRGSSAKQEQADTLMRAASGGEGHADEELVRASARERENN